MKQLVTTEELQNILKVSRQTVYDWRKKGMPFIQVDRAVRFDLEEVEKWLKEEK